MAYIALIGDQYLKDNAWVNQNVDPQLIRPTIRLVQEMHILPLLGTALYNKVQSLVTGSPTVTLTGNYGTLLHEYIQPCMLWYVVSESTVPIAIRMTNKNILRKQSDNSTPADINEILTLKDEAKNKAEWYAERMRKFIVENEANYPEYNSPGDGIDTIRPRRKPYDNGLSLKNYFTETSLNANRTIYKQPTKDECCDP